MEISEQTENPLIRYRTDTTVEDNSMPYAPAAKRRRTSKRGYRLSYKRKTSVARNIGLPANNSCMIPLTTRIDWTINNIARANFTFDCQNIYIDGGSNTSPGTNPINGATELSPVFHLSRVAKVEMTFVPSSNGNDYSSGSLVAVPVLGTASNYISGTVQAQADMMQKPDFRSDMLTKQIKRTFYPRLEGSNGIVDVGVNRRNLFEATSSGSTQRWRGCDVFIDPVNGVSTNQICTIYVKVFLECMASR